MALKKQKLHHHNNKHLPVLLAETIRLLAPKSGESYLDLTAGYGGHVRSVLARTKSPGSMVLIDRDKEAIEHLADLGRQGAELIHSDYLSAVRQLIGQGRQFHMILADLGVSSPHFDKAERGFSFMAEGPLDMRMDQRQELTAGEIVNSWPEDRLAAALGEYGQQAGAYKMARAIADARPLKSTKDLAQAIEQAFPRRGKRHPATKAFQAIRIAVNDELNQLSQTLPHLIDLLEEGGRLAIISFHSLEDRQVKRFLNEEARSGYEARLKLLTPRAVLGNQDVNNPRARSARLRAACKINIKNEGSS
ncbi:MAG TPA: 16S rRNA (cytosine(1402)-N(4))-methyltransferase RsmH [Candidatus Saccharimonadales bacterium]